MKLTNTCFENEQINVKVTFDDSYLSSLGEDQKYWLQYKALREFSCRLRHLNNLTFTDCVESSRPAIQQGIDKASAKYDESQLIISDQEVMQDWEIPLMKTMAAKVTKKGGRILEIGFGMGLSASQIVENGVESYTVIECNPQVIKHFHTWKKQYPECNIRLIEGRWQDVLDQLDTYDGIFFDTYPLDEIEWLKNALNSVSFAEDFFSVAAKHLNAGGLFTYYTGEIDSISNEHQRLLFKYFRQINICLEENLKPPKTCQYWWNDTMVVVTVVK